MVWLAAAAAAAGMAMSYLGGQSADDAAKKAGQMNSDYIMEETAEAIRRTKAQQEQQYGTAVANIGGSGARGSSGTPANYLNYMQTEQQAQLDWMQKSGESQALIARETGQMQGSSARDQATSSTIGQFGNFATSNTANEMYAKFGWT